MHAVRAIGGTARVIELLDDPRSVVKTAAARELGTGDTSKSREAIPKLVSFLSENEENALRETAASSLSRIDGDLSPYALKVIDFLSLDRSSRAKSVDPFSQSWALDGRPARSLIWSDDSGRRVVTAADVSFDFQFAQHDPFRAVAIKHFRSVDPQALLDRAGFATEGAPDAGFIAGALDRAAGDSSRVADCRFAIHYLCGGSDRAETLLAWLGGRGPAPEVSLRRNETIRILRHFDAILGLIGGLSQESLQLNMAQKTAVLIESGSWVPDDLPLLRSFSSRLREPRFTPQARTIDLAIWSVIVRNWWQTLWPIGLGLFLFHAAVWMLIVLAYPLSPAIQENLIWNRWSRALEALVMSALC